MTTRAEIAEWFDRGVAQGATHLIVVCDTFNYEDYPAFATGAKDVHEKYAHYDKQNMQRIVEVYDLHADKQEQMAASRVMRMPPAPANFVTT